MDNQHKNTEQTATCYLDDKRDNFIYIISLIKEFLQDVLIYLNDVDKKHLNNDLSFTSVSDIQEELASGSIFSSIIPMILPNKKLILLKKCQKLIDLLNNNGIDKKISINNSYLDMNGLFNKTKMSIIVSHEDLSVINLNAKSSTFCTNLSDDYIDLNQLICDNIYNHCYTNNNNNNNIMILKNNNNKADTNNHNNSLLKNSDGDLIKKLMKQNIRELPMIPLQSNSNNKRINNTVNVNLNQFTDNNIIDDIYEEPLNVIKFNKQELPCKLICKNKQSIVKQVSPVVYDYPKFIQKSGNCANLLKTTCNKPFKRSWFNRLRKVTTIQTPLITQRSVALAVVTALTTEINENNVKHSTQLPLSPVKQKGRFFLLKFKTKDKKVSTNPNTSIIVAANKQICKKSEKMNMIVNQLEANGFSHYLNKRRSRQYDSGNGDEQNNYESIYK